MKYTYEDVITVKDILTGKVKKEDIIGKTGWASDYFPIDLNPFDLIEVTLARINTGHKNPFQDKASGLWFSYFIPEKDEIKGFSVGDRVRIVKDWDGFGGSHKLTIGETGRIESVFDDAVKVRLDSDNDWWWYSPDAVELIEDKAALSPIESKDKPAYIPFDLSKEEDRDALRDKWVISNNTRRELKISAFEELDSGTWIASMTWLSSSTGEGLLAGYTFLDGSPVGKLKDMPFQQIASK